jgi:hypothetical protein
MAVLPLAGGAWLDRIPAPRGRLQLRGAGRDRHLARQSRSGPAAGARARALRRGARRGEAARQSCEDQPVRSRPGEPARPRSPRWRHWYGTILDPRPSGIGGTWIPRVCGSLPTWPEPLRSWACRLSVPPWHCGRRCSLTRARRLGPSGGSRCRVRGSATSCGAAQRVCAQRTRESLRRISVSRKSPRRPPGTRAGARRPRLGARRVGERGAGADWAYRERRSPGRVHKQSVLTGRGSGGRELREPHLWNQRRV